MAYHINEFSKKVSVMNQTGSKGLTMSAAEARNLYSEIFDLINRVAELTEAKDQPDTVTMTMDGGSFKR